MTILTELQKALARDLLNCIANGQFRITYLDLAKPYGIDPHRVVGNQIGEISKRCYELGLPLISAMVIRSEDLMPGKGFKGLCDDIGIYSEMDEIAVFLHELQQIQECDEWYKLADDIGAMIPELKRPISDPISEEMQSEPILEGKPIQINATAYERNPEYRKACIEANGTKCKICGFDAGEIYGKDFSGRIHIHHIIPLGNIKKEHTIDPVKDMIPVCPNCHMILHSKKDGVYTPDEVRRMLKKK